VTGTDKASGKSQQITIQGSTGLSKEEIERMKRDAEEHASEDAKKKERIEHQNLAETMIYTSEKMLKDAGDKISAEEREEVEEKIEALKKVKDGDDHEAIKKAADELSTAAQKVGVKMYQGEKEGEKERSQEEKFGGAGSGSAGKEDQPIDAEFTEKKE
jgi:molecular chaperone DnaK